MDLPYTPIAVSDNSPILVSLYRLLIRLISKTFVFSELGKILHSKLTAL